MSGAGVGDQLFSNISVQIERVYINNVVILVNPLVLWGKGSRSLST